MTQPEYEEDRGLIGRLAAGASDMVLDLVDPNQVLDNVDVNALLERVDVNDLLDRVDVNRLLDRVDVNLLLERVDVNQLMDRVDVDALMERVDVQSVVDRAGIPEIVAESTGHLTGSALDLFRKPIVGLDEILLRFLNRLIGRDLTQRPQGPADLVALVDKDIGKDDEGVKTGRYAGPLTRLLAFMIDVFVLTTGFTLITAGTAFLLQLISSDFQLPDNRGWIAAVVFTVWAFLYLWLSFAIFGKTVGKAVLGVRVVAQDGDTELHKGKPVLRALVYPFSIFILGLGLIGVVFGRERQGWHDHAAGTTVVYDWGSRTAALPTPLARYLERKQREGNEEEE